MTMNKRSQLKVIAYGFTIIRSDDQPSPRIKFIDKGHHDWKTLEAFETKAARDRRMALLLENAQIIED